MALRRPLTIDIDTNLPQVQRTLASLPSAVRGGTSAGVDNVTEAVLEATEAAMQRGIYDQPLPESMKERGLVRTGALKAAETSVMIDDDTRLITTKEGPVKDKLPRSYARWRHEYEDLPAPWRGEGLQEVIDEVPNLFLEGFVPKVKEALRGR